MLCLDGENVIIGQDPAGLHKRKTSLQRPVVAKRP
jgi:hypothetical protein